MTVLTLDCATPAPAGSASTTLTSTNEVATFLNSAANLSSAEAKITCSAKSGFVYSGKGNGGSGIPQKCLKIGKATDSGSITFTIPDAYDEFDLVEMTCYGWKTTSSISVNGTTAQTFATALAETKKTFELSASSRTIAINVTTSAVCITEIVLKKTSSTGGGDTPTPTTYTVTFDAGEGTFVASSDFADATNSVEAGTYTLPSATRDGYTFDGWIMGDADPVTGSYTVSSDVNFTAQYTEDNTGGGDTPTPSGDGRWELTALSNLTASDIFVIVCNNGNNYALSNDNGTGSAPTATPVTIAEDKITSTVADNLKWKISGNATDGYTFYPNGSTTTWLYCTNSNNGVRVGANTAKTFTVDHGYLKHAGTSRYVGVYNSQDWRCYTAYTAANIENQTFSFYKYAEGAPDTRAEAGIKFEEESKTVLNPGGIGQTLTNPNNLTISYTSSDENVATINNDGTVNLLAAGQTIITATFAGNDEYKPATVSYTLNVMENASISVEDTQIAFGNSYSINAEQIKGGDITVTSNNTAVATVNGLTITPVAVGETTIIVSTAENNLYNAGSKSFKLTVTMPEGLITAAINEVFNETFSQCTGTGGHTDGGNFDNGSQNGSVEGKTDESWSTITTTYPANGCGRIGSGSNSGTLSTTINLRGNATLTFSAAGWKGNDTNTIAVTADGATLSGDTNITLTNAEWHNYTVNITGVTDEVTLTFTGKRGFLDDIKVSEPATINVTLNGSGYATYCSLYPLDFTHAEGYTAWQITDISENVITFEKVAGPVKGGTGLLLKGEAGATVTLTSADSQTALNDNLLFGTLAPTYISAGKYYGLSGKTFVKVNAGTVPAGKALLPASLVTESAGVKAFTFVFNDLTTGVNAVDNGQWTMEASSTSAVAV